MTANYPCRGDPNAYLAMARPLGSGKEGGANDPRSSRRRRSWRAPQSVVHRSPWPTQRQLVFRQAGPLRLRRAVHELRGTPRRPLRQLRDQHVRARPRRRTAAVPLDPEPVAAGHHRLLGDLAGDLTACSRSARRARAIRRPPRLPTDDPCCALASRAGSPASSPAPGSGRHRPRLVDVVRNVAGCRRASRRAPRPPCGWSPTPVAAALRSGSARRCGCRYQSARRPRCRVSRTRGNCLASVSTSPATGTDSRAM